MHLELAEKLEDGDEKLDFSLQAMIDINLYVFRLKGTTNWSFGLISYIT